MEAGGVHEKRWSFAPEIMDGELDAVAGARRASPFALVHEVVPIVVGFHAEHGEEAAIPKVIAHSAVSSITSTSVKWSRRSAMNVSSSR